MNEFGDHGFRRQGERDRFVALQAVLHGEVALFVRAIFDVDPLFELLEGVAAKGRFDRAGFKQADVNPRAGEFEAQYVAPAFERVFGGAVGAAKAHGRESHHRAGIDDAAMSLRAHDGQHGHGEFVPAEQTGVDLVGERDAAQVFEGGGDGKGTVIEESIEGAAGLFQYPVQRHTDAVGFVQIELHRVQAFLFQAFDSGGIARAGEDLPAAFVQHMRRRVADAAGTAGDEDAFGFVLCHGDFRWMGGVVVVPNRTDAVLASLAMPVCTVFGSPPCLRPI